MYRRCWRIATNRWRPRSEKIKLIDSLSEESSRRLSENWSLGKSHSRRTRLLIGPISSRANMISSLRCRGRSRASTVFMRQDHREVRLIRIRSLGISTRMNGPCSSGSILIITFVSLVCSNPAKKSVTVNHLNDTSASPAKEVPKILLLFRDSSGCHWRSHSGVHDHIHSASHGKQD